ncbi:flagellar basal body-associated FliL family protein [Modestobacter sp. NPDC049651]|uniref:flagellar basal body-associated FliL family protein n=1 Tax=unclassified Modestobacter TaxID=2643866 RepID=UPI0033CF2251
MAKKKKAAPAAAEDGEEAKGGKKKLMIIALVAVLAIGAGAYFFVFSGGSSEAEPAPEPGSVLKIDPVAINLAGGSYLKLGMTLQFTAAHDAAATGEHGSDPDGSPALDIAIAQFSGAKLADVQTNREAMKAALEKAIVKAYHEDVMKIYYTEYVTQ